MGVCVRHDWATVLVCGDVSRRAVGNPRADGSIHLFMGARHQDLLEEKMISHMNLLSTLLPRTVSVSNARLVKGVVSAAEFNDGIAALIADRQHRIGTMHRVALKNARQAKLLAYIAGLNYGITEPELRGSSFGKRLKYTKDVLNADLRALLYAEAIRYEVIPDKRYRFRTLRMYFALVRK